LGLFGPKLPVDREEFEWLLACFAWLHSTIGRRDRKIGYQPTLVLPSDAALLGASTARELFDATKRLAGLEQWHCELVKGDAQTVVEYPGLAIGEYSNHQALGMFSIEGNTPVIHYNPQLLNKPHQLVATFAHELAHLLINDLGDPPGGPDLHEHATDCAAVYLGFGIFLANGARNFSQFQDSGMHGWQSEAAGYLSENALVTALAIFIRHFHMEAELGPYLKAYLRKDYKAAHRYIAREHPNISDEIDKLDLAVWS
jgi:hypothetical protein